MSAAYQCHARESDGPHVLRGRRRWDRRWSPEEREHGESTRAKKKFSFKFKINARADPERLTTPGFVLREGRERSFVSDI